jgi:hypothetical protein
MQQLYSLESDGIIATLSTTTRSLGTTHAFTTCEDGTIALAFQILKIFDLEEFSNSLQVPEQ